MPGIKDGKWDYIDYSGRYIERTGFEEWNAAHPDIPLDTSIRLYHEDIGSTYKTVFRDSVADENFIILNHLDHSSWNTPFSLYNWEATYGNISFFGYSQGC